jgi:hypothetical protein
VPEREDKLMLGKLLVLAIGLAAWKYRDSLGEYVKSQAGPAKEKADELLLTAQQKSETLLDRAKERVSSGIEGTREKLSSPGAREADRGGATE